MAYNGLIFWNILSGFTRAHLPLWLALFSGISSLENSIFYMMLSYYCCFAGSQRQQEQQKQQLFNEYLRNINAELSYVQLELRACRNQYDGNVYYGVVNNVSDDQSKLGTKYTVPQIAFYKGIVSLFTLIPAFPSSCFHNGV